MSILIPAKTSEVFLRTKIDNLIDRLYFVGKEQPVSFTPLEKNAS